MKSASYLHSLKSEVNKFLEEDKETPKSYKDSLDLLEKINAYYLRQYYPKRSKNKQFNQQIRSTTEQALLKHKKRKKSLLNTQKTVTSNAIDDAHRLHRNRMSD